SPAPPRSAQRAGPPPPPPPAAAHPPPPRPPRPPPRHPTPRQWAAACPPADEDRASSPDHETRRAAAVGLSCICPPCHASSRMGYASVLRPTNTLICIERVSSLVGSRYRSDRCPTRPLTPPVRQPCGPVAACAPPNPASLPG